MITWLRQVAALRAERRRAVAVTVVRVKGSAPREPGAKMLVEPDAIHGTIGGGNLELTAVRIARAMFAPRACGGPAGALALRRFPLGATLGQCCGGAVDLLFEPLPFDLLACDLPAFDLPAFDPLAVEDDWVDALQEAQRGARPCVVVTPIDPALPGKLVVDAEHVLGAWPGAAAPMQPAVEHARRLLADGRPGARVVDIAAGDAAPAPFVFETVAPVDLRIVLFGAGHVGRALVGALAALDCDLTWVDDRDAAFPPSVPEQFDVAATDAPLSYVNQASPGTCFLVMTYSHALDLELTEAILRRGDFHYLGLIGSVTKRRRFEQRLGMRGFDPDALARIRCPIGIAGIESKEPAAIAIAVAAELLQLREAIAARAPLARGRRWADDIARGEAVSTRSTG
jgi:xanthine dehydrogenase accessory factor